MDNRNLQGNVTSSLQNRIEFEQFIAAISTQLISLTSNQIEKGVDTALAALGQYFKADRCNIFQISQDGQTILHTHSWQAVGAAYPDDFPRQFSSQTYAWWIEQLHQARVINISDPTQLPAPAASTVALFAAAKIQSALAVPMIYGNKLVGLLQLESIQTARHWPEELFSLLKIVGEMFVSVFGRQQAETALRQSEERFQQVINSISDHVYHYKISPNGAYTNLYLSPNIETLTGYSPDQFAADWSFWPKRVIHPQDQPAARQQARQLASGQDSEMEYRMVRANGDIIWVRDSGRTHREENALYVYGVVSNITERKKAEEALVQERALLAQRVRERTAELSLANAELARANRLKDEFLAAVSHELRTPLNTVLGMSEALQEYVYGPVNDKQMKALRRIEESGRHLLSLINDILDLSRIEAGKLELQLLPVDIDRVCHSSLRFIEQKAQEKNISVATNIQPGLHLEADERRLKQVLINLLDNAVKFTPAGGKIGLNVTANPEKKSVELVVWDTGIGIAQADMDRLFKPFLQLDSRLARQYEGTGLGLALVYRMIEMHGGSVKVESEPGHGSQFTISLPLSDTPTAADSQQQAPSSPALPALPTRDTPLILLVEDNETNILTMSEYLLAHNYQLLIARTGTQALEQAKQNYPDVILMDIQIPVMDGLETTRLLKADSNLAQTPIIALTALAMPGDRERCLAAGADEYLSKPVSLKQLVTIIEQLRSANTPDAAVS